MFVLNYEGAEMKITNPGAELRSFRTADGREWMRSDLQQRADDGRICMGVG